MPGRTNNDAWRRANQISPADNKKKNRSTSTRIKPNSPVYGTVKKTRTIDFSPDSKIGTLLSVQTKQWIRRLPTTFFSPKVIQVICGFLEHHKIYRLVRIHTCFTHWTVRSVSWFPHTFYSILELQRFNPVDCTSHTAKRFDELLVFRFKCFGFQV